MSYNWGRRRNRLRKGKRGMNTYYEYGSRATYRRIYSKPRRTTPEWGALHRAWVGYVIAKSQDDYENMRKYAIVIRKFQRRLNIRISDFLDIRVYGFEEDFENKEEEDDSKLVAYDPWNREKIRDSKEGEDEDEDADDGNYHSWHRE
jgi:phage terminase large subunit-like protein